MVVLCTRWFLSCVISCRKIRIVDFLFYAQDKFCTKGGQYMCSLRQYVKYNKHKDYSTKYVIN